MDVRFCLSHAINITLKTYFWREHVQILPYFTQLLMDVISLSYYLYTTSCFQFYCMALYNSQSRRHVINKRKCYKHRKFSEISTKQVRG